MLLLGVALVPLQAQATRQFRTRLSPVPVAAYTATVVGSGTASATLTGTRLVVTGTYAGLASPATKASLYRSQKPGMRGDLLLPLTVSGGTTGTIAGEFTLTAAQVAEVTAGRYYVQLSSEKAAEGNLWGWLLAQENR